MTLTRRVLAICLVGLIAACGGSAGLGGPSAAPTLTADQIAWAKAAQLGEFAPKTQDWDAIKAAALKEGKVVVYSNSSRIADVAKSFEAAYPGIKVEGQDISGLELNAKLKKEQEAGIFNADVIFNNDTPTLYNEMLNPPNKYLWKFVPQDLESVIGDDAKDPLLVHHYSLTVWIYNSEVHKTPPLKNIWDVTKPEWKGKIILPDPTLSAGNLNTIVTLTAKPEEMAKAYQATFGKPIVLEPGVPNASYQWIKDLLKNQPVLTPGSDEVGAAVGAKKQTNPPIGVSSYSKIRNVLKGDQVWAINFGMSPVIGAYDSTILAIANQAPHPNAAKLMIRWYMGDTKGGQGMAPYFVPGDPSPRSDMAIPTGAKSWSELQPMFWKTDPTYNYKNQIAVRDFWIANKK